MENELQENSFLSLILIWISGERVERTATESGRLKSKSSAIGLKDVAYFSNSLWETGMIAKTRNFNEYLRKRTI